MSERSKRNICLAVGSKSAKNQIYKNQIYPGGRYDDAAARPDNPCSAVGRYRLAAVAALARDLSEATALPSRRENIAAANRAASCRYVAVCRSDGDRQCGASLRHRRTVARGGNIKSGHRA